MNDYRLCSCLVLIVAGWGSVGCAPVPTPEDWTSAHCAPTPSPVETPIPQTQPREVVFYNGTVLTMEDSQPVAEAIIIEDGIIVALGDSSILPLARPNTVFIDLQGATVMPGFADGHTHILRGGSSLEAAQEAAIRHGFTSVTEMSADETYLCKLIQAEQAGSLRLRVNVFPSYNDAILDASGSTILLKTWYPGLYPILEPSERLRIPGIKVFVDGANVEGRGCWALSEPYSSTPPGLGEVGCGTDRGDLYLSQDQLNTIVAGAQHDGYRVALHAMGDRAIDTALNAIQYALAGKPKGDFRHQIEHNSLARPDQLKRYEELGVLVSVRGHLDLCDADSKQKNIQEEKATFGPERIMWYVNRYVLADMGVHAYVETDFGWTLGLAPDDRFSQRTLDPMMQLYGLVTHRYVADASGIACEPASWLNTHYISIERALQMMTIEPAYAVSMEPYVGTLEKGKFADLIILSGNPLAVDPGTLKDLHVWMTMIGGKVEYCAEDHQALCPP